MGDFLSNFYAGVAATIVAGIVVWIVKLILRLRRRSAGGAVAFSVARMVKWEWSVAFVGEIPPQAREIEGKETKSRKVYDCLIELGAVDVFSSRLRLSVRGLSDETVIIRNIRVDVEQSEAISGTRISSPNAGVNEATMLLFDLEDKSPVAKEWQENEDEEKTQPFFDSKTVTLARNEVHDFIIIGSAKRSLVLWRLYLDLEVGGRPQTIEIDENGKPFKTTGYPGGGFGWDLEWAWHDDQRFQQIVE